MIFEVYSISNIGSQSITIYVGPLADSPIFQSSDGRNQITIRPNCNITCETNRVDIAQLRSIQRLKMITFTQRTRIVTGPIYWDGGGIDDYWETGDNWTVQAPPSPNDELHFSGEIRTAPVNNFVADTNFSGIIFDAEAASFILNGNRITIGTIINNSSNLQTLMIDLVLPIGDHSIGGNQDITLGGIISGDGSLVKTGSGILTITGTNIYNGTTTINEGVLKLNGTLASLSIINNATLIYDRELSTTYDGIISGAGPIIKNGSSTLILTGANIFTGILTINSGILQLGNGGATGSIENVSSIVNNAMLTFNNTGLFDISCIISGIGTVTKQGSGTQILSGANTYSGATTISDGTLKLTGSLAGDVNVSGGTLTGPTITGANATITGAVTISNSSSSIIQPGSFGNNTLNTGPLTFDGANSRFIANSTANTFSKIVVNGDVALGGCTIDFPAGITTSGAYKLITATGTMSGTLPTIGVNGTGELIILLQNENDLEAYVLWTPKSLSTQGWFDANDLSTIIESGGAVSQWDDKSGNTRHLTQAIGANQPITGIRTLNGMNVLDFNGLGFLARASWPTGLSVSVFVVAVLDAIDNASDAVFSFSSAKDFGLVANNASQFDGAIVCVGASNPPNTPLTGGPFPGPSIYNGSVNVTGLRIRGVIDGTIRADTAYIGGISSNNAFRLFADRTGTFKPDGAVGEVVIVSSTTTAGRQQIEGYLAWKWGIQGNLPVTHPYKLTPPV